MARFYAHRLVIAIRRIFRCRVGEACYRGVLIVMLAPFMSARSLNDAAQTSGVPRHILYDSIDELNDYTVLQNIRRVGLERLSDRLLDLRILDSSGRSRKCVTLCADDFTRAVRGKMGGLAHPCYSGADKSVVYGLRIEALVAVIGEGEEVIILDVRVIPPRNPLGRPRSSHTGWLLEALTRLETSLGGRCLSLQGCFLSVDSAYAPGWFVATATELGLKVVSELRANIRVWSWFWLAVPASIYFALFLIGHGDTFKPLGGEPAVQHLRHRVMTKVYGEIVVVLCDLGPEVKRYFTTDLSMKSITVRRVAKRRWQIERIFWNLKQLLGLLTYLLNNSRYGNFSQKF